MPAWYTCQVHVEEIFSPFKVCKFVDKSFSSAWYKRVKRNWWSKLWSSFSLKNLLREVLLHKPDRYGRQFFTGVEGTVEFAGTLLCIRRSRMLCDRCWPLIFCAQSQTRIWISQGTGLLTVVSQGLPHLFMETFVAIFPDLTNRPWVSEDEEELGKLISDASQKKPKDIWRRLHAFITWFIRWFISSNIYILDLCNVIMDNTFDKSDIVMIKKKEVTVWFSSDTLTMCDMYILGLKTNKHLSILTWLVNRRVSSSHCENCWNKTHRIEHNWFGSCELELF